jgi:hypothetical protein
MSPVAKARLLVLTPFLIGVLAVIVLLVTCRCGEWIIESAYKKSFGAWFAAVDSHPDVAAHRALALRCVHRVASNAFSRSFLILSARPIAVR